MKNRTTIALFVVFLAGMAGVWWADYSKIPTERERMRYSGLVLPALLDLPVDQVKRVEIESASGARLAFVRKGRDSWQMTAPVEAAADASMVDTLVRSLKDLRPVTGSEALHGSAASYGLDKPAYTVRLFGEEAKKPLTALAFGSLVDHQRYVKPAGSDDVQVIDARWFGVLDRPAVEWREKGLFALSSFMVDGVDIKKPEAELEAMRTGNQWRLTRPYRCLADNEKLEGIVADAVALRVADGAKGYVADDVKDFSPYGLDKPALVITLTAGSSKSNPPQTVAIGKALPDVADRAYARRADQDDVVLVDTKHLQDLKTSPTALRSQKVADIDLARVDYIQIENEGREHALALTSRGWRVEKPTPGQADRQAVQAFLNGIGGAEAFEVLGPEVAKTQKLDKPWLVLKMWQGSQRSDEPKKSEEPAKAAAPPRGQPALVLRFGRDDLVAKTVYAQVNDDPAVLAVPDQLLKSMPSGSLDFLDRNLLALRPGDFTWLAIRRGSNKFLLKPGKNPGDYSQWHMVKPVEAEADTQLVARLLVMLSNLRADSLVADNPDNLAQYGLDEPALSVSWSTQPDRRRKAAGAQGKNAAPPSASDNEPEPEFILHVGKETPAKTGAHYAKLGQGSLIFTINAAAYGYLNGELHDRRVLSFTPDHVKQLTLRWPTEKAVFARPEKTLGGFGELAAAPGASGGFTADQANLLLRQLSALQAVRFTQYEGRISAETGLSAPRLTIEAQLIGKQPPLVLRLGRSSPGGTIEATTATGDSGPVFLLNEPEWATWLKTAPSAPELPANPFAP